MSIETGERVANDGFKPIKDFGYDGRFPDAIEINEKAIREVFKIARLPYNGIAIKSMPSSDMYYAGNDRRKKPLFTTEKVNGKWEIQVNDEEMMEKLERQDLRKSHRGNFTQELNGNIKAAVFECIRKEKDFQIGVQSEKFLALGFKAFTSEFLALGFKTFIPYEIAKCWFFLHPKSGITLVRQDK